MTLYAPLRGASVFANSVFERPLGVRLLPEREWDTFTSLENALNKEGLSPSRFIFESEKRAVFELENGTRILFTFTQDGASLTGALRAVLTTDAFSARDLAASHSPIEYLDLRFGRRVYYK